MSEDEINIPSRAAPPPPPGAAPCGDDGAPRTRAPSRPLPPPPVGDTDIPEYSLERRGTKLPFADLESTRRSSSSSTSSAGEEMNSRRALRKASSDGDIDKVMDLLPKVQKLGPLAINEPGRGGWTALHWAARNGHAAIVQLLLGAGADTKVTDTNNATPLDYARMNKRQVIVEVLEQGELEDGSGC